MENIVEKLNTLYNDISGYHELSDSETKKVSDIIYLTLLELDSYTTAVEDRVERLTYYKDAIGGYDYNYGLNNLINLSEMFSTLRTVIYRLYGQKEINVESTEGIISLREIKELDKGVKAVSQFLVEYESDINKASDNQELVWSQIEAELAEERKKQGFIKSLTAGAELVMYAVMLRGEVKSIKGAASAFKALKSGKNLKAVITGGAEVLSDGSMVAVSGANLIEGIQDIYYGYKKDPYTKSKNFIADPLFGDDKESYERFTLGLQIANAAIHPLSEFALVSGGGKASYQAEKLILASTAIEGGTSLVTEGITHALNLNEYESLSLSLTTGVFVGGLYYHRPVSAYDSVPDIDTDISTNMYLNYAGDTSSVLYGTDDIAKYQYNIIENPGPLAELPNQPANNFYGGRYNMEVLQDDIIMYRAGNAENPYGRWFTSEPPSSIVNVRIDTAVKTHWIDPKTGVCVSSSYIDNVYAIKIPKGMTIYTGPVGSQGGAYVGGYSIMQTYIDAPWNFEVIDKISLQ